MTAGTSSLLHSALIRAHSQQHSSPNRGRRTTARSTTSDADGNSDDDGLQSGDDWDMVSHDDEFDLVLVPVRTEPPTPFIGSPSRTSSRPTSPTRSSARAARRQEKDLMKIMCGVDGTKTRDPLRRFPNEVSLRIFEIFVTEDKGDDQERVRDFLKLHRVCRRWRKSQTINYIWFHMFRFASYTHTLHRPDDPNAIVTDLSTATRYLDDFALPNKASTSSTQTWTRREAGTDWSKRYKSVYRRDDLEGPVDWREAESQKARSSGWQTPAEVRESKWEAEKIERAEVAGSKKEQRKYYKSLANSKVKGKKARETKDKTGMDVDGGDANPWEAPW